MLSLPFGQRAIHQTEPAFSMHYKNFDPRNAMQKILMYLAAVAMYL